MIPGLGGGLNPKKVQQMMRQMGINSEEIDADRVVIERNGGKILIENPSIQKIVMQGQESWQISGDIREEADERIKEEDVELVSERTGKGKEEARKALEETGDIAEAIVRLSEVI